MAILDPYWNREEDRKDRHVETCHHILEKSRAGSNIAENKIRLYECIHIDFHRLFGNLTVDEQLRKLLNMQKSAFSPEFIQEYTRLLRETDKTYYYKNGIYLNKNFGNDR